VICALESARRLDLDFEGARVAIQGFGNVGSWAARIAADNGARVVAASDVGGGSYKPDGLDVASLVAHQKEAMSLVTYSGGESVTNEELLEVDCDILIPAAIEGVIGSHNADRIKARIVVEAANGPTTPVADEVLTDRGITVVPDILANAGGVTVSYFEWVQNIQQFQWDLEQVNDELTKRMRKAIDEVWAHCDDKGMTLRDAAFDIAVERVARAAEIRGYI
jgi:glutamate dehydrogenase (NAD(P)+)